MTYTSRAVLLLAALGAPLSASAQEVVELTFGKTTRGALPTGSGGIWQTYRIDVPAGTSELDLRLSSNGDADLYVRAMAPMDNRWAERADASSDGPSGRERITLTAADGLCACAYYVDVVHGGGATGEPLKFSLRATRSTGGNAAAPPTAGVDTSTDEARAVFSNDFEVDVDLTDPEVNYATYRLDVPPDTSEVVLELTGADTDLDLYARHGGILPNWFSAHHRANGAGADETLVISREGSPRLRSGTYYLDVGRSGEDVTRATLSGRFVRGYEGDEPAGRLPEASTESDVSGEIRSDTAFRLNFDEGARYRTFLLYPPNGARSITVRAIGADGDVDLYLRHLEPIGDYGEDPDHAANSGRFDEQLYVDARSEPALQAGRYFLDISRSDPEAEVGDIDFEVLFNAPEPDPLPAITGPLRDIELGDRVFVDVGEEELRGARFRFDVPRGTDSVDIRVFGATRDIDMFVREGEVITDHGDASGYDASSVTTRLNEHIRLDGESSPPLRPGTWYVDVASLVSYDSNIAFELAVTPNGDPLDDLTFPPFFDVNDLTPTERALQAVVQVASENGSGSGTNLHRNGWIITNHHVIEDAGEVQEDDIFISFVSDFDEPPEQLFVARAVEWDEELDLALLQVHSDIFGRPVSSLDLPWLPLGDPDALRHGDLMYIAGFPQVGGFESRTTLSLTRGIVAGVLAEDGERTWLKTDARINAGNSGGTAFDGDFNYVGVPSRERVVEDDELGYSRPVSTIPQEWLDQIR